MIEQQEIQKLQKSWKKQGKAKEADDFLVAREKFLVASGMEAERAKDLAWKNTVEAFPYVEPPKPKKKAAPTPGWRFGPRRQLMKTRQFKFFTVGGGLALTPPTR